jgi:hypothetical protein
MENRMPSKTKAGWTQEVKIYRGDTRHGEIQIENKKLFLRPLRDSVVKTGIYDSTPIKAERMI